MRRNARASEGASSGWVESCIAAASITASSAITHDRYGCGERNQRRTGYDAWVSATSAAHSSHRW